MDKKTKLPPATVADEASGRAASLVTKPLSEVRIGDNLTADLARDLVADLATCDAATVGGWMVVLESAALGTVGTPVCRMHGNPKIVVGHGSDWGPGASVEADALFIARSRAGWPAAIRRAMAAEAEVARLKNPPGDAGPAGIEAMRPWLVDLIREYIARELPALLDALAVSRAGGQAP